MTNERAESDGEVGLGDPATVVASMVSSPLWNAAPDGMAIVDRFGTFVASNRVFDEVFLQAHGALTGQPLESVLPPRTQKRHTGMFEGYFNTPRRRPLVQGGRLQGRRSDGSIVDLLISLSPISTASEIVVIVGVRDISDLMKTEEQLATVAKRHLIAEEHERIARDLHDTVIQELYGLGMTLELRRRSLDGDAVLMVDDAIERLNRTIAMIRSTIGGLTTVGLSARSRVIELVGRLVPGLGFEPAVEFVGDLEAVGPDVTHDLMAVVGEALSNVARHADASSVTVEIGRMDGRVWVEVVDDGRGTEAARGDGPPRRSGLSNLADRAARWGGSVEVASDDHGTRLHWEIPMDS